METLEYTLNIRSMRKSWEAAPDYELAPYVPPPTLDEVMSAVLSRPAIQSGIMRNNALLRNMRK